MGTLGQVPPTASRPLQLRGQVFRGGQAIERGWLTRGQLCSSAWRPLLSGVYADAALPVTHGLYIRGARLVLPTSAVLAGRSAAWWYGAHELRAADDPVEFILPLPQRCRRLQGVVVRSVLAVGDSEVVLRSCGRITSRARTAYDVARTAPEVAEAVAALDHMLATRALRPADLPLATATAERGRGCVQARRALMLADGRAESLPESRLRVGLVADGLPPPVPQFEVRIDGRFVARVDLAYPEQRVAIEYDGAWHAAQGQFARDRRRLNALVAAGWRVIHVTAADMYDLAHVVQAVRTALAG